MSRQYSLTANETLATPIQHNDPTDKLNFIATGTFGGGSLKFQIQLPDGTWQDIPETTITSEASKTVNVKAPSKVRYDLSGATTPSITLLVD